MKKIRLSALCDRFLVAAMLVILVLLLAAMVYVLRSVSAAFYAALGAGVFLLLIFGTYAFSIWAACCDVHAESNTVTVHSLRSFSLSLSGAVSIAAVPFRFGSIDTRRIVFYDAEGDTVAAITTSFLLRSAAHADTAAQSLADALHLSLASALKMPAPSVPAPEEINYDLMDDAR